MSEHAGDRGQAHEKVIGAHHLRFEPSDLFVVTLVGDVIEVEMRAIIDELRRRTRGWTGYFELIDMRRLGSITPAARRAAVEPGSAGEAPILGAAIFGASFQTRVLAFAMMRVKRLLERGQVAPTEFFATKEEAQAWIDARRRATGQE